MCFVKEIVPYIVLGVCLIKATELPGITILFPSARHPWSAIRACLHHILAQVRSLWLKAMDMAFPPCRFSHWTSHSLFQKYILVFVERSTAEKSDSALEVGSLLIVEWRIVLRVSIFGQPINWILDFGTTGLGRGCHRMINSAAIKWITKTDSGSCPLRNGTMTIITNNCWLVSKYLQVQLYTTKLGQYGHVFTSVFHGMGRQWSPIVSLARDCPLRRKAFEKMRARSKPCLEKGTSPKALRPLVRPSVAMAQICRPPKSDADGSMKGMSIKDHQSLGQNHQN